MCGRYVSQVNAAIEAEFRVIRSWSRQLHSFNIAPTAQVPAVVHHQGRRVGTFLRWGLVPAFAQGVPGTYATHNARIETVRTAPAFRTAWQRGQRCLVIAQGFYEWQVVEGDKQPWYIACADQPTFAFAGLWDQSRAADGEPLLSCTVLTLPASPLMAGIHNTKQREPAILRREDHEAWLTGTADEAWAGLRSYPDELRSAWPVSRRVNVASNDDLALIDPLAQPAG